MIQTIEGKDEFLCVCPQKYCVISFVLLLFPSSGVERRKKGSTLESSYPYKCLRSLKRQQLSIRHNGVGQGGVGQLGNPTKDDNVQFFLLSTQSEKFGCNKKPLRNSIGFPKFFSFFSLWVELNNQVYLTISNAEIFICMGKKGGETEKRRSNFYWESERLWSGFVGSCGFLLLFYNSRTCWKGVISIRDKPFANRGWAAHCNVYSSSSAWQ